MARASRYEISATWEQLASDSSYIVGQFLNSAINKIDHEFGPGFSASNPALVGSFIQAAAAVQAGTYSMINGEGLEGEVSNLSAEISALGIALREE
ncbi:hypothetical protein [Sphingomonas montanisoli]|uniref:Uncharacterized protein n=1 Tax=Sphingomonas montanisoli TaxID=2606412 RepID=A0A5D9C843_9SPHN|nr:hypothetical protein [Sphingomonas montanisoli]TZG27240.1 hypothetical protein FYJ91_06350 [Sphingomonas montanisoli]